VCPAPVDPLAALVDDVAEKNFQTLGMKKPALQMIDDGGVKLRRALRRGGFNDSPV
jgi:hypothetical protein